LLVSFFAESAGSSVTALIFLPPFVQVNPVISKSLHADRHGDQVRLYLAIETIPIHAEIDVRILGANYARQEFHAVWLRAVVHGETLRE